MDRSRTLSLGSDGRIMLGTTARRLGVDWRSIWTEVNLNFVCEQYSWIDHPFNINWTTNYDPIMTQLWLLFLIHLLKHNLPMLVYCVWSTYYLVSVNCGRKIHNKITIFTLTFVWKVENAIGVTRICSRIHNFIEFLRSSWYYESNTPKVLWDYDAKFFRSKYVKKQKKNSIMKWICLENRICMHLVGMENFAMLSKNFSISSKQKIIFDQNIHQLFYIWWELFIMKIVAR